MEIKKQVHRKSERVNKTKHFNPDQTKMDEVYMEYLDICQEEDRSKFDLDQNPMNMDKNRYPDVLVIKETAVKLGPIVGVQGSEYINANFVIDKSNNDVKKQKYICCQAPLGSTFNDFWRMIWEFKVPVIVMITNLVEKNRIKADPYWPTEPKSVFCYGGIFVKLVREKTRGNKNVTIRIFKVWKVLFDNQSQEYSNNNASDDELPPSISTGSESGPPSDDEDSSDSVIEPTDGQEIRQVVQLHCTKWPDFGVPKSTGVMKDLIAEVDIRKKGIHKPIVVHCSAGIGRTGTFVAIHMSLQKDLVGEEIDIRNTVKSLRSQRLGMVQSKEQYMFVYSVVQDILSSRYNRSCIHLTPDGNSTTQSDMGGQISVSDTKRRPYSRRKSGQNQDTEHHTTPTRVLHGSFVGHQQFLMDGSGPDPSPWRGRNIRNRPTLSSMSKGGESGDEKSEKEIIDKLELKRDLTQSVVDFLRVSDV